MVVVGGRRGETPGILCYLYSVCLLQFPPYVPADNQPKNFPKKDKCSLKKEKKKEIKETALPVEEVGIG